MKDKVAKPTVKFNDCSEQSGTNYSHQYSNEYENDADEDKEEKDEEKAPVSIDMFNAEKEIDKEEVADVKHDEPQIEVEQIEESHEEEVEAVKEDCLGCDDVDHLHPKDIPSERAVTPSEFAESQLADKINQIDLNINPLDDEHNNSMTNSRKSIKFEEAAKPASAQGLSKLP